MKTIAFFEIEDWEKEHIKRDFKGLKVVLFEQEIKDVDLKKLKNVEIISIFIYSKITKELLKKLPKLRFIATRSTGFDHIDVKACKELGIKIAAVPNYGIYTVAEQAFALLLTLSRKIEASLKRTRSGIFNPDGLTGFDLHGKTMGVIGLGSIGIHVVDIANGFGMNVLAYDVNKNQKLAKKHNFTYVALTKLLKNSDIISLHVPYNKKTHHLINEKNMKLVKKGAILINTSRGPIVDTTSLFKAIKSGRLAGAGLDVLEEEAVIKDEMQLLTKRFKKEQLSTLLEDHLLLHLDDVVITPHNAFNTKEALERIMNTTIQNIKLFLQNKKINTLV